MADQTTIDQLRALLGQLTAEQDQQRAAEEHAKQDEQLSVQDRITMIRAEQALNGKSVSADQLEHVLRILEGLTSETASAPETTAQPRTPPVVDSDVPPTTEQHTVRTTEQQPQNVQPNEYAGLVEA